MWSPLLLLVIIGLASSVQNPGWNPSHQYIYKVYGRSFASLGQISNDYSGFVYKAILAIQPRPDGNLGAKILEAEYAKIHNELKYGWDGYIPEDQLNYQELPISKTPVQLALKNGVLRNLIVDKHIKNWEANFFKSVYGQFLIDIKGQNVISSSINSLSQEETNTAIFKVMEESITGVTETLYEIQPYPEYLLQSEPWLVPHKDLIHQGDVFSVQKLKNFTNSLQAPSYHAGFEGIPGYKPGNTIADYLTRSSISTAFITGSLQQYTIQSVVSVETIVLSPTFADVQKGLLNSQLNTTLWKLEQPAEASKFEVPSPVSVGLVYRYDEPYNTENVARPAQAFDHSTSPSSAEADLIDYLTRPASRLMELNTPVSLEEDQETGWLQELPEISDAPPSPLLPFTVGYEGQALKKVHNIIEIIQKLVEQIGQEFLHPKEIIHQHTASKFVILVSLVRTLNQNEIQQIAGLLYAEDSPSWVAYRDAVAQAGTGPALYSLKMWIKSGKLTNVQAAQLIVKIADATRQPTEAYMKFFFEILKDESLMSKPLFNETALLSFSTLVRYVYVDKDASRGKFPIYSYGSFRTVRGQEFVKKTVIPYFTSQLKEAIEKADHVQIYPYIRALGNIAHPAILEAFEPYLEGPLKATNFQRLIMVSSLDYLVRTHPIVARSVLYKIYQNPSELAELRIAAVYLLPATGPSATMLQRMAVYTNIDPSSYVSAAVKSVFESIYLLDSPDLAELRTAVESALPLLTTTEYGAQYATAYFRSSFDKDIDFVLQQFIQTYSGYDHVFPKGLNYIYRTHYAGVKHQLFTTQAMVSSIDDLLTVFSEQTKEYQQQKEQKQSQQGVKYTWSSEYVAKILGLENEQREQLESFLYLQFGPLEKVFSFDNITLENLPEVMQYLEEQLKQGQHLKYYKMFNAHESAVAFPTLLGFPFLHTYDRPVLVKTETDVKVSSKPELSNGEYLQVPDVVDVELSFNAIFTGAVQSQFGIITPFDHQRYSAGYNKNFQLVVPLTAEVKVNLEEKKLKVKLQNPGAEETVRLGHYSSWPYTAQNDVYNPKPNVKIIRKQQQYKYNFILGDKSTGIAFYVQAATDRRMDLPTIYEKFAKRDIVEGFVAPWSANHIQYVHIDFGIDSQKSTTEHVKFQLSYETDYQQNEPKKTTEEPLNEIPSFPEDLQARQKEFVKKLGSSIANAEVLVVDAAVSFEGPTPHKYTLTAGAAKSNVDPRGHFMALVKKLKGQTPVLVGYVQGTAIVPNTNGLSLDYAMQMNPKLQYTVQGLLRYKERLSKLETQIQLEKSLRRVEYLKQLPEYKECKHQMQKGNTQLPICAYVTTEANFLDQFALKMKYSNMEPHVANATYSIYGLLRYLLYPRVEENILESQPDDRLLIKGQFSPDFYYLNATVESEIGTAEISNVKLNKWARLLIPHPVFHLRSRIAGELLKEPTYRPICVLDKLATNTFDNKTFVTPLTTSWRILMQYVPRRPSPVPNKPVLEQLHQTVESYVVYARAAQPGSADKEIQIVLQMPSTKGKVVKILMKPSKQGKAPKVLVNDEETTYSTEKSADFYKGHIQIYALPNREVKLEIQDALYLIFNGQTLKISVVNSKFRDSIRGICGTFTGEPETDFVGPDDCIYSTPQDFVDSYTVDQARQTHSSMRGRGKQHCYQKVPVFADYISDRDAGRYKHERKLSEECTGHLNRYVEKGEHLCFSIRALPFCKSGCRALSHNEKLIDVHCILAPLSNAIFWKEQIDKKVAQDFSMTSRTEQLTMKVPTGCVP